MTLSPEYQDLAKMYFDLMLTPTKTSFNTVNKHEVEHAIGCYVSSEDNDRILTDMGYRMKGSKFNVRKVRNHEMLKPKNVLYNDNFERGWFHRLLVDKDDESYQILGLLHYKTEPQLLPPFRVTVPYEKESPLTLARMRLYMGWPLDNQADLISRTSFLIQYFRLAVDISNARFSWTNIKSDVGFFTFGFEKEDHASLFKLSI